MKLNKNNSLIFATICFVAFIICLIFSKTTALLQGVSCIFLGVGFIFFGVNTKHRYQYNLIELDKKYSNMLKDIEIYGQQSEYNGLIDEDKKVGLLNQFIKKNKKNHIVFYAFGVLLILFSIFMLI